MKNYYNVHTIWIAMLLLTLSTYSMGKLGMGGIPVMGFLILTAVVKGAFIIHDFMELKGVSLLWRVILYGWLWTINLAIIITYLISC